MPGLSRNRFHISTKHIATFLTLAILFSCVLPNAARAQTEPVQFTISGTIETAGPSPLDHAQLIVYRAGTSELLASRVFSAADGGTDRGAHEQ